MKNAATSVGEPILIGIALILFVGWLKMPDPAVMSNMTHLKVIWPYIDSMNQHDKMLLTDLSSACKLNEVGMSRGEIITCLRGAALKSDHLALENSNQVTAAHRLESMYRFGH